MSKLTIQDVILNIYDAYQQNIFLTDEVIDFLHNDKVIYENINQLICDTISKFNNISHDILKESPSVDEMEYMVVYLMLTKYKIIHIELIQYFERNGIIHEALNFLTWNEMHISKDISKLLVLKYIDTDNIYDIDSMIKNSCVKFYDFYGDDYDINEELIIEKYYPENFISMCFHHEKSDLLMYNHSNLMCKMESAQNYLLKALCYQNEKDIEELSDYYIKLNSNYKHCCPFEEHMGEIKFPICLHDHARNCEWCKVTQF